MILYPEQLDQNPNMEDLLQSDSSVMWSISDKKGPTSMWGNALKKLFGKSVKD